MPNPFCVSPVTTTDNFQFLWSTSSHLKAFSVQQKTSLASLQKEIPALCSQKKRKKTCRLKPRNISLAEQQPDSRSVIDVVVQKNEIDLCWCAKTLNNRFPDSQTYRNRGFKSLNPAPVVNYGRCKQSNSKCKNYFLYHRLHFIKDSLQANDTLLLQACHSTHKKHILHFFCLLHFLITSGIQQSALQIFHDLH